MLEGRHLAIGIPSYDGGVVVDFASSYAKTVPMLREMGVKTSEFKKLGCCYVDKARDEICHVFLKSDATDLLFIDSDMGWKPDDVVKLMARATEREVVCGMYCLKKDEPDFRLWTPNLTIKDGLIRAEGTPAGFLLIRRSALEKIRDAYPELQYQGEGQFKGETMTAFFHMHIEDGLYFREDIAFGKRWSKIGDGVWIDPTIKLRHWSGCECFERDFGEYVRADIRRRQSSAENVREWRFCEPDEAGHQPGAQP